jgi:hypothetical protein
MSVPRSLERLQDVLDGQLSWRKKEIVALRNAALRSSVSREYFCRAGSVMLCAHWEGFLKSSIQAYVDHVFSQGLPLTELKPPFVAIYFFRYVKNAADAAFPGSESHHIKLAKKIVESVSGRCSKAGWDVDTNGNPSSSVCSQVLVSVGLDPRFGYDETAWSVVKVFIDSQILKDRHKIAHGERFPVRREHFIERSERVIKLCEDLAVLVMAAAGSRSYQILN